MKRFLIILMALMMLTSCLPFDFSGNKPDEPTEPTEPEEPIEPEIVVLNPPEGIQGKWYTSKISSSEYFQFEGHVVAWIKNGEYIIFNQFPGTTERIAYYDSGEVIIYNLVVPMGNDLYNQFFFTFDFRDTQTPYLMVAQNGEELYTVNLFKR